jgi:SAM-dependent methyltransferase
MLMHPGEYRVMFEIEDNYWWYRGFRVLLESLLARYAPADRKDTMILDAGCGTGANLTLLAKYGHTIGVDLSEEALEFCRARGIPSERLFAGSVTDLPFSSTTFDLVTSFEVICNIRDDAQSFAELARVLKPGGRLIVQLPAHQSLWGAHDVAVGHQRRYDARDLGSKLVTAGFEIERVMYSNMTLLPFVAAIRWTTRRAPSNGTQAQSDLQMPLPRVINLMMGAWYSAEMRLAARVNLPFGLSVIGIARKNDRR